MKRAITLFAAFALLVASIESLHTLVAWWQAGRPAPEWPEFFALMALAVAAWAWWRHSVFGSKYGACRIEARDDLPPRV